MPGDLPEHVNRDTGIGHPSQTGVTKIVAAQVLVAELGDNLIPVSRVPQHRGADPAAAWTREDTARGVMANRVEVLLDCRPL
jgi:hypothetical protein